MTTQEATLVAAVIAAVAAVLKLIFDRYTEDRSSARVLLQPLLAELGEAIYSTVATSSVLSKTKTPEKFRSWYRKACRERQKLQSVRPKVRYPLWGLDEGLRVLERVPEWCAHARTDGDRVSRIIDYATSLRNALDKAAVHCYFSGRQPSTTEVLRVRFYAWRCRRAFENTKPSMAR